MEGETDRGVEGDAGAVALSTLLGALRPDFVRLDMGLVQNVDQAPYRAAIASKLLELSKDLKVAVETEEQWWLLAHDADFAQGYFFASLPIPYSRLRFRPGDLRRHSPVSTQPGRRSRVDSVDAGRRLG